MDAENQIPYSLFHYLTGFILSVYSGSPNYKKKLLKQRKWKEWQQKTISSLVDMITKGTGKGFNMHS